MDITSPRRYQSVCLVIMGYYGDSRIHKLDSVVADVAGTKPDLLFIFRYCCGCSSVITEIATSSRQVGAAAVVGSGRGSAFVSAVVSAAVVTNTIIHTSTTKT